MNVEKANAIPLPVILRILSREPVKSKGDELWFLSPLRTERTASFHVCARRNVWYDFGEGTGGDVVALIRLHLERSGAASTCTDALRWLRNMAGGQHPLPFPPTPHIQEKPALELISASPLTDAALVAYLKGRGITEGLACKYLKQARVRSRASGKEFLAAAMANEDGGFELRNKFFKGTVKTKAVSFVRGAVPKPPTVHIFEGMIDFLSAVTARAGRPFDGDAIILHSVSMVPQAAAYVKGYGYRTGHTWTDNDPAGERAARELADLFAAEGMRHMPMNQTYAPHNDVNAALIARLGL